MYPKFMQQNSGCPSQDQVFLTDKLDPDSGSVVVEAKTKKKILELRAELKQRFYSTSGDLK